MIYVHMCKNMCMGVNLSVYACEMCEFEWICMYVPECVYMCMNVNVSVYMCAAGG